MTSRLESLVNTAEGMAVAPSVNSRCSTRSAFHTRSSPSAPAEKISCPSGLQAVAVCT